MIMVYAWVIWCMRGLYGVCPGYMVYEWMYMVYARDYCVEFAGYMFLVMFLFH